jgi:hypothetical protein
LKQTIKHEMKAVIQPIRSELDDTTAGQEATETEPNPGMMQSIEEHQEIPKGEAMVMPVGEPRKQQSLQSGHGALPENEGKDPGISWLQEEVGCCLQEGVPLCKSGMVKKEICQENLDPGRLWTSEGIGRRMRRDDALCKSETAQGMQS